jgi:hypothetical protein
VPQNQLTAHLPDWGLQGRDHGWGWTFFPLFMEMLWGTLRIAISQMRKLKLREVGQFSWCHTIPSDRQTQIPGLLDTSVLCCSRGILVLFLCATIKEKGTSGDSILYWVLRPGGLECSVMGIWVQILALLCGSSWPH